MEILYVLNKVTQNTFILMATSIVFFKITNYHQKNNKKEKILMILISIIEASLCVALFQRIPTLLAVLITYILHSITIAKATKNKVPYSIIVISLSLVITYIVYAISIILTGIFTNVFISNIEINNPINLLIIMIIESLILYAFFKIKRFKNGFSFLEDSEKVNNIGIIGCAFIGIVVMIYSLADLSKGNEVRLCLLAGVIIEFICLVIWIRRKITKHYKQIVKKDAIQELEDEIAKRDEKISEILEENKRIATINHKYSSRITALEKVSTKLLTNPEIIEKFKTEFGEDFGELEEQIKKISEEFSNEMENTVKYKSNLIKTGIFGIDNLLEHLSDEAEKQNIKFYLKVNGSINYMVEKVINQSKLETLLGDHIKDAIIAIQHSNNTNKRILTIIGIIDNIYEVCIYDTGIEFEIETLLKLGTEQITTHKDTGGSGIGFMTTFETLKETKASLIIEENHPENSTDYTKAVRIRFDGKNEYKIKSYRAEKIKKQQKDNRVIIEKI